MRVLDESCLRRSENRRELFLMLLRTYTAEPPDAVYTECTKSKACRPIFYKSEPMISFHWWCEHVDYKW